jgi:hypothetical protein
MTAPADGHHYDLDSAIEAARTSTMGEPEPVTVPQDTSRFENNRPVPPSRADARSRFDPGDPAYPVW